MASFAEIPVAELGAPRNEIRPVRQVRSTLLAASIQSLRQRGLYDRYLEALPREWRERLPHAPAGTWLPVEWAEHHYGACEALGLDDDAILALGNSVAEITQRTVFSITARLAREAGASPLTVLAMTPRLWGRLHVGGAVGAFQTGPKDVRFETIGCTLARFRYWRVAYRGIVHAISVPFCRSIFVRETGHDLRSSSVVMKLAWA